MRSISLFISGILACLLFACNQPVADSLCTDANTLPKIFPDYSEVTIPVNIAPLNFDIEENGIEYQSHIRYSNGKTLTIGSKDGRIDIPIKKWKRILDENKGKSIEFTVYVKDSQKKWIRYKPFKMNVSADEIDNYLAYRLINVGYIYWKKMGLYQRDLTSFEQDPIMLNRNTNGNCMNCHNFSQNNPSLMMFHMRGEFGGTMIIRGDTVEKINSKTPNTIAAGVYPSWHPDGKHIAFSVNKIKQWFHSVEKRNEVYDRASDIVVYNTETREMTTSPKVSTDRRENLPNWSPDGKYIYFSSTLPLSDTIDWYDEKYDLMRVAYDVEKNVWGNVDTILLAKDIGGSISFPKISPDGKWLMFTRASHGYFTIFNSSSDLFLLNLETRELSPFEYNSDDVDSYHCWSSNGKWIVFSSKRIDGLCTRPFFTHIDENGKLSKPFVLPQRDPLFYRSFKENFNVPELIKGPVKLNEKQLLEAARGDAKTIQFDQSVPIEKMEESNKANEELIH